MHRVLITTALLLVFGASAYMSIYGLTAVFVGIMAVVICMGAGMELGKLLVVTYLHRKWRTLHWIARGFYMFVVAALCLITSVEVMGFLSQCHAVSAHNMRVLETDLRSLEREAGLLRGQIAVIDRTLAGLPEGYVTRRIRERRAAGYEAKEARLLEISRKQAGLKSQAVRDRAFTAPVFTVARIVGIEAQQAVFLFILALVAILEPLSVGLAVAASGVWMTRPGKPAKAADRADENRQNGKPAKAANRQKRQNGKSGKTANDLKSTGYGLNQELLAIMNAHGLDMRQVAEITGRMQLETVRDWVNDDKLIPIKAMRDLRKWAKKRKRKLKVVNLNESVGSRN